jgi:hypothetical protein
VASWGLSSLARAEQGVRYTDLRGYVALGNGQDVSAKKKGIQLTEGFDYKRHLEDVQ